MVLTNSERHPRDHQDLVLHGLWVVHLVHQTITILSLFFFFFCIIFAFFVFFCGLYTWHIAPSQSFLAFLVFLRVEHLSYQIITILFGSNQCHPIFPRVGVKELVEKVYEVEHLEKTGKRESVNFFPPTSSALHSAMILSKPTISP